MKQQRKNQTWTRGRRATTVASTAVLTLGLFVGGLAPASAAGPGTGYDGTDPAVVGCASDAITIATKDLGSVIVDIRYSPNCQTNWIRVLTQRTDVLTAKKIGRDGSANLAAYTTNWETDNGTSHSMQVYAPGSTCVTANVNVYWGEYNRYFIQDWRVC